MLTNSQISSVRTYKDDRQINLLAQDALNAIRDYSTVNGSTRAGIVGHALEISSVTGESLADVLAGIAADFKQRISEDARVRHYITLLGGPLAIF